MVQKHKDPDHLFGPGQQDAHTESNMGWMDGWMHGWSAGFTEVDMETDCHLEERETG